MKERGPKRQQVLKEKGNTGKLIRKEEIIRMNYRGGGKKLGVYSRTGEGKMLKGFQWRGGKWAGAQSGGTGCSKIMGKGLLWERGSRPPQKREGELVLPDRSNATEIGGRSFVNRIGQSADKAPGPHILGGVLGYGQVRGT